MATGQYLGIKVLNLGGFGERIVSRADGDGSATSGDWATGRSTSLPLPNAAQAAALIVALTLVPNGAR